MLADYYYLYFRDEYSRFIDDPEYQEQNEVGVVKDENYRFRHIGQNRRGDFIRVDRRTNEMIIEQTREEWTARRDRLMKEMGEQ